MTKPTLLLAAALALAPIVAHAQADPAASTIEAFNGALLETMKAAKSLGPTGRYRRLQPAVEAAFDLPTMTRVLMGPSVWSKLSAGDQAAVTKAFTRVTVANYAHNFDDFTGEKFVVNPKVETRAPDKLVRTQIVGAGAPVSIAYRMRQAGGEWKVVDVFLNGTISQLAAQRSDYSAAIASGGAPALLKKLDTQADGLLKGK